MFRVAAPAALVQFPDACGAALSGPRLARRAELSALTPEHNRAVTPVANDELRMHHDAVPFGAQTLGESKRITEPLGCLAGILVDQNRHDGCGGRRLIGCHAVLLS